MARESESGAAAAGPYWGSADSFRLLAENAQDFIFRYRVFVTACTLAFPFTLDE